MKKMIRTVAAAAAVLMAPPALADDDAEETDGAKPLIALELELGFGTDWTFKADDRTAELADAYPDIALAVTINATDWLAFNLGVTVESVLDPVGDRRGVACLFRRHRPHRPCRYHRHVDLLAAKPL